MIFLDRNDDLDSLATFDVTNQEWGLALLFSVEPTDRGTLRPCHGGEHGHFPGATSRARSVTANVQDERKTAAQRKAQRSRQQRENPGHGRGRVAEQAVRDWDPAQRARIRASLLQLRWFGDGRGELWVVALIDQIGNEP